MPRLPLSCPACHARFKSSRGLGIHQSRHCRPKQNARFAGYGEAVETLQWNEGYGATSDRASAVSSIRDLSEDNNASSDEETIAVTLDAVDKDSTDAADASTSVPSSSLGRRLLLQATRVLNYKDKRAVSELHPCAGRPAGEAITNSKFYSDSPFDQLCRALDESKSATIEDLHYFPFESQAQFGFAAHIRKFQNSKAEINALLGNQDIPIGGTTSRMRNANDLFSTIESVPYGLEADHWDACLISVAKDVSQAESVTYQVFKRDVESAVRFLIGYRPFRDHTRYTPVQEFDDRGERLYSDFMTADWVWNTQERVEDPQATIVPVKIYSDKTLLTNVVGEQAFHPVGIQILNHSNELLNRIDVPNYITVGFIPVVLGSEQRSTVKAEIYHLAMSLIFDPLIELARIGTPMLCADGYYRQCYPIIAGISADYEEQVLISGVKKNRQCTVCTVPFHQMEVLYGQTWPRRTHLSALKLHRHQEDTMNRSKNTGAKRLRGERNNEDTRIHIQWNYLWGHTFTDTYDVIMPDLLHQIEKGWINYIIHWLQVYEPRSSFDRSRQNAHKETHAQFLARLDARFRAVPPFTGVRTFSDFTGIQKWQGGYQRAVMRQLSAVMVGLFLDSRPERIMFANALTNVDYILRAKSISESMLHYFDADLFVLDTMKYTWDYARTGSKIRRKPDASQQQGGGPRIRHGARNIRTSTPQHWSNGDDDQDEDAEGDNADATDEFEDGSDDDVFEYATYNIPKWHMLTHYPEWIRSKGSPQSGNTSRGEVEHKELKSFYERTNKQGDWVEQICRHVTRSHRILAMGSYRDWLKQRIDRMNNDSTKSDDLKITKTSVQMVDLNSLKWPMSMANYPGLDSKYWRAAFCVGNELKVSNFVRVIATLIRNSRARLHGEELSNHALDRLIDRWDWATDVWVGLHNSITCYRPTAKTATSVGEEEKELVYCSPRWRNETGKTRRDCVWVQEYPEADSSTTVAGEASEPTNTSARKNNQSATTQAHDGRRIGRLVAIVTVLDPEMFDDKGSPVRHQGAVLDMFNYENGDVYHRIHRMIRLTRPATPRYQAWPLDTILRSAHVVPISNHQSAASEAQKFVVNHASDWHAWMTLAPDDFLEANTQAAIKAFRENVISGKWTKRPHRNMPRYKPPPSWVMDVDELPPSLFNSITSKQRVPVAGTLH